MIRMLNYYILSGSIISIGNRTCDGRLTEIIVHTVSSRREDKTTLGLWRVVIIILRARGGVAWRWALRVISIKRYTKDTRRQDWLRHRGFRVTSLNLRSYNSNNRPPTAGERTAPLPTGWAPLASTSPFGLGLQVAGKGFRLDVVAGTKNPTALYLLRPHCRIDICRSWRHIRDIDLQLLYSWWFLHVEKQRKYNYFIASINSYFFYSVNCTFPSYNSLCIKKRYCDFK